MSRYDEKKINRQPLRNGAEGSARFNQWLGRALVAGVAVLLCVLWGVFAYSTVQQFALAHDAAVTNTATLSKLVEAWVHSTLQRLNYLAVSVETELDGGIGARDLSALVVRQKAADPDLFRVIEVRDPQHVLIATSDSSFPTDSARNFDSDLTQTTLAIIGLPRAVSERILIPILHPLTSRNGEPLGTIVVEIDPSYFSGFSANLGLPDGASVVLMRADGPLLARNPPQLGTLGGSYRNSPLWNALSGGEHGSFDGIESDGTSRVVSYRTSGEFPLVVSIGLSSDRVYAEVRRRMIVNGVAGAVLSLVIICAAAMLRSQFNSMTGQLQESHATLERRVEERTAELAEALQQQTATADILRAIASSPGEPQHALNAIAETALRLFGASSVNIRRLDGGILRYAASLGPTANNVRAALPDGPPDATTMVGAAILQRRQIVIQDVTDPEVERDWPALPGRSAGARAIAATPLYREGQPIGGVVVHRAEPKPFTDKELAQLSNFADQAVIAIENARLLSELRESLDRQTATADVLGVISSSPGDLQPVFETMLENAVRLCEATEGAVFSASGNVLRRIADRGMSNLDRYFELVAEPGTLVERMVRTRKTVHIADLLAGVQASRGLVKEAGQDAVGRGVRSSLWVPMVKDNVVVGAFVLNRCETRPFTEAQIGLVENFANQAVIAIENARLLSELRGARDAAEQALGELKTAQASLIQAEKMASLGQLTAGIAHEIKNPLNFVNNFASLSVELLDELKGITAPAMAELDANKRAEVDELIGMLTGNLEKVADHGRRADGIVKSMLAHSRGGSGERQSVALNALVEESLNLAYHGARAQDQSFNVTLERDLDPSLAPIEVVPQDLTRVFLNLFGNGFYAANKRRLQANDPAFKPILKVMTRDRGADVEIRIRDNGTGIPPDIRDRLFEPFFTTKPTGEGTGLGLSISYEIVTQQHGGVIEVESAVGEFTEFIVRLPRRVAAANKSPSTDARS